jgi:hypothetical protein
MILTRDRSFYYPEPAGFVKKFTIRPQTFLNSFIFVLNKLNLKQFNTIAFFLALFFLHVNQSLVSQEGIKIENAPPLHRKLAPITPSDSLALVGLPILNREASFLKASLPSQLDNATQPYFRPLFEQVASECGQYASIAFNFTYEINYARNVLSSLPENQYPTHYTYNFMNGGFGWHGVSYFHSFEVARVNGHPNVVDFGSLNTCGPSYWMSGYDKYYRGMFNKLDEVYQIQVATPDGLLMLKNWLHNHLSGDDVGGIACFYSSTPWNTKLLPEGTPEGGKHVITNFLSPATHSSTISGYNDSIRYDYNGDGQYTNHIDINGDGLVDMRDWEKGGLIFTDSYLGGTNWADSGFCYMMYKTLADRTGEGGIWNNVVHVVKVKEDYSPKISLKLTIEHNCREKLKIMAGVSESISSIIPQYTIGFPVFDFQGGCQHMQGGWTEEAKTLELGLDITPLLGRIQSDEPVAFHLLVFENDPNNYGTGKIVNFSIVNHLNDNVEFTYPETNVPLTENGLSLLSINAGVSFDEMLFGTDKLPMALTGEEYEHQMLATGGTPPYTWNLVQHYSEEDMVAEFPEIGEEKLEFTDTMHSQVMKILDFEFPFYGKSYDSIWVHTDGFIMFDDQVYPWPYLYDEHLMIRKTRNISPFLNNFLYLEPGSENGIWYEGNQEEAAFRWHVSSKFPAQAVYEFALVLHKDGRMAFYYDNTSFAQDHSWAAGISMGDGINYQYLDYSSVKAGGDNRATHLIPMDFPSELSLTKEGLLSGKPEQNYPGIDLVFDITDNNLLNRRKIYKFHSYVAGARDLELLPARTIRMWPNPAKGELNISFTLKEKARLQLELTDPAGKSVLATMTGGYASGLNNVHLDLSAAHLKPGLYFLVFRSGREIIGVKKVVVMQ